MAQETARGCGYRKVGGYYLVGGYISVPCDRLPFPLETCPVCGGGIKVSRGFTKINPLHLFGEHDQDVLPAYPVFPPVVCKDVIRPCLVCDPENEIAFIMQVGKNFYPTPDAFMEEARRQGISKRIPFVPKELVLGKTIIYLAHPEACEAMEPVAVQQAMAIVEGNEAQQGRLLESEKKKKVTGIFSAFIPLKVEKLIWKSEASPDELEKLGKRNITPVIIKDGDSDHA